MVEIQVAPHSDDYIIPRVTIDPRTRFRALLRPKRVNRILILARKSKGNCYTYLKRTVKKFVMNC